MQTVKFLKNEFKSFGGAKVWYEVLEDGKHFLEIEVRSQSGKISNMNTLVKEIQDAIEYAAMLK